MHHVLKVKLWGPSIWHHRVLEVTCEGSHKQRRRKGNIESNVTECAAPLKQQSKKAHTLSEPWTKDRARNILKFDWYCQLKDSGSQQFEPG